MKLNKIELKKILYEFNSKSNRLMQVDFQDFPQVLAMYLDYIDKTDIIIEFINNCGKTNLNLKEEFDIVRSRYGSMIFSLGTTDEEEVRNIYAILKYMVEINEPYNSYIFYGYASDSKKYQDKIKGFNDRVTLVLIRHIETFLTKIGIEMGMDEHITYNVKIENGQFNVANDNATINATVNNGIDTQELTSILNSILDNGKNLPESDFESIQESLEVIKTELSGMKPKKSMLNTAINGLKAIKGTVEFAAAVATLIQFLSPFI